VIRGISSCLYGWMERFSRDGVEWDWESLYAACADSGVDAVETDPQPEKLAIVRRLGLQVSSSYIGLPFHLPFGELDADARIWPVAERLADAGGSDLVLNADQADWTKPTPKTVDDLKRQGENLSRVAERAAALGLRTSLHNHAHTFDDASADLASVTEYAHPSVGLCVDTGWAHHAGHDPLSWIMAHPGRVYAFHFRNERGGIPTEDLREGDIDITSLVKAALARGFDGWLGLELWHPQAMTPRASMAEAVRVSAALLRDAASESEL
jgi:inosose dehydratase